MTSHNKEAWYGWVPNLSGNLFLNDINYLLARNDFVYNQSTNSFEVLRNLSDLSDAKPIKIIVNIPPESSANRTLHFQLQDPTIQIECIIEKQGLLQLNAHIADPDFDEEEIVNLIYVEIKDVFHEHTHHFKTTDRLLTVVWARSREEAISKIRKQYKTKIIEHHHYLRTFYSQPALLNYLLKLFTPTASISYTLLAEGEMLYALALNEFYGGDLKQEDAIVFRNSLESFKNISNKINQILQDYSNKLIVILTILIGLIALIGLSFNIFKDVINFLMSRIANLT